MIELIIPVITVVGGVLIAYLRWRTSATDIYKKEANENEKAAKLNAIAAVATISDTIKFLRNRAKRKKHKS